MKTLLLTCLLASCMSHRHWDDHGQLVLTYHDNGKVDERGYIAVNRSTAETYRSGLWTRWHDNGQVYMEGMYVDGERDGLWRAWHDNGASRSKGYYRSGLLDGVWTYYDKQGAVSKVATYRDGELVN